MSDKKLIDDTKLNSYLDQELAQPQAEDIREKLLKDEDAHSKLNDYNKINQTLHQLYDPVLDENIPKNLLMTATQKPEKTKFYLIAASVLFFLTGSLFGWHIKAPLTNVETAHTEMEIHLIQPAMFAHTIYTTDKIHPVEVKAEQHEYLNQWLSKRLKTKLNAPDLSDSNYQLIGGRLLPSTQNRMAAQYMYENQHGNRITLYVRDGNWKNIQPINYQQDKSYTTFYWTDKNIGYALISDLNTSSYQEIAKQAYQQLVY